MRHRCQGDGGGSGDEGDGVQPRAGIPPPWLDGETGTGLKGLGHRIGDESGAQNFRTLDALITRSSSPSSGISDLRPLEMITAI
ncbi:hypothetical protein QVD17_13582 [Tagetes erecta]|uniref:Uncharacterized protein n=1 Tax=Tagetes erecta TaxID=13708 RepID=A0AAD8P269_TARER|nr:hypothetical protein QVD17_13582 [Tagetes erecta]